MLVKVLLRLTMAFALAVTSFPLSLALVAPTPAGAAGFAARGISIRIPAGAGWVSTNLAVNSGDAINIHAAGCWNPGGNIISGSVGPDGADGGARPPSCTGSSPVPNTPWPDNFLNLADIGQQSATTSVAHWAALVGYVGINPPKPGSYANPGLLTASEARNIFFVGSNYNGNTDKVGTLWLAFNDDAYSGNTQDNTGEVDANVAIKEYKLPVPGGYELTVSQGNDATCDKCDHNSYTLNGLNEFAYDFGVSGRRFPIMASMDGTVIAVRKDSTTGGCDAGNVGDENFILILEADGYTADLYMHLARQDTQSQDGYSPGIQVNVGDPVKQGQFLGIAGTTGYACGTHLHFQTEARSSVTIPPNCAEVTTSNFSTCKGEWWFAQSQRTYFSDPSVLSAYANYSTDDHGNPVDDQGNPVLDEYEHPVLFGVPVEDKSYRSGNATPFNWYHADVRGGTTNQPMSVKANLISSVDLWADHVLFTWGTTQSGSWNLACQADIPNKVRSKAIQCSANLSRAPKNGPFLISFDSYDKYGNQDLSPDGERTISPH